MQERHFANRYRIYFSCLKWSEVLEAVLVVYPLFWEQLYSPEHPGLSPYAFQTAWIPAVHKSCVLVSGWFLWSIKKELSVCKRWVEIICIQFWGHSQMHSNGKILIFSPLLANAMRFGLEETTGAIAEKQWQKVSLLSVWLSHIQKYHGGKCRFPIHAGTVFVDVEDQLPTDLRIYWNIRKPKLLFLAVTGRSSFGKSVMPLELSSHFSWHFWEGEQKPRRKEPGPQLTQEFKL